MSLLSFRGCAGGFWEWRKTTSCLHPIKKNLREYPVVRAQPGAMRGGCPHRTPKPPSDSQPLRPNLMPLLPATAESHGARAFPHDFLTASAHLPHTRKVPVTTALMRRPLCLLFCS